MNRIELDKIHAQYMAETLARIEGKSQAIAKMMGSVARAQVAVKS